VNGNGAVRGRVVIAGKVTASEQITESVTINITNERQVVAQCVFIISAILTPYL